LGTQPAFFDVAPHLHHHPIPQNGVVDLDVGFDAAVFPDYGSAFQKDVGVDDRVPADADQGADERGLRLDEGDARGHMPLIDLPFEVLRGFGQLFPAVDSQDGFRVFFNNRGHGSVLLHGKFDEIGEIKLLLHVVGLQTSDILAQEGGIKKVGPGVDFPDGQNFRGSVPGLDHRGHGAVGAAHHPAVVQAVGEHRGLNGHRGPGLLVRPVQRRYPCPGNEGNVAAKHQDVFDVGQHRAQPHLHGVPGASLGLLDHKAHRVLLEGRLNFLSLITHHGHDIGNSQIEKGVQKIGDHGPAQDFMQHLGPAGFHPGSLARGQDEGGGGDHIFSHITISFAGSVPKIWCIRRTLYGF
jgi:hypothetical protein